MAGPAEDSRRTSRNLESGAGAGGSEVSGADHAGGPQTGPESSGARNSRAGGTGAGGTGAGSSGAGSSGAGSSGAGGSGAEGSGRPEGASDRPDLRPRDLAAMMAPLARSLIRAEEPVLAAQGLTMWGYSVLLALRDRPARSQAALAASIGADKTRLIVTLDDLQERGLIERYPDPADHRVHLLAVPPEGRRAAETQAQIQRQEAEFLAQLPPADRAVFLRSLEVLSRQKGEDPR